VTGRTLTLDHPISLAATVFPLRRGHRDPTTRIGDAWVSRGLRTPDGPATLRIVQRAPEVVHIDAEGPGAGHALEVDAPGLVGAHDDDAGFDPAPGVIRDIWRRHRGVRLSTAPVLPVLLAAICEQKVTGVEARAAWASLVRATSERAPGPDDLWLPPDPERVAALPSFAWHRAGVERRRADVARQVASRAVRIASFTDGPALREWLVHLPGIGVWTAAETARIALADADAVSVGDYHLPDVVAWVLAGEPRGDDARMLELLEPFRGHRGRVQRLLEASGLRAPAWGPRAEVRTIATI